MVAMFVNLSLHLITEMTNDEKKVKATKKDSLNYNCLNPIPAAHDKPKASRR